MGNQPLLKSQGFTKGYEDVSIGTANSAKTAAEVTADALMFVEDVAGDPFFLHVHYAEPHEPVMAMPVRLRPCARYGKTTPPLLPMMPCVKPLLPS